MVIACSLVCLSLSLFQCKRCHYSRLMNDAFSIVRSFTVIYRKLLENPWKTAICHLTSVRAAQLLYKTPLGLGAFAGVFAGA